jgi:hypothetical protein
VPLTLFLIPVGSLEIGLAQTAAQPGYSIDRDEPFWIEKIVKLHGECLFSINVTPADGNKVHSK